MRYLMILTLILTFSMPQLSYAGDGDDDGDGDKKGGGGGGHGLLLLVAVGVGAYYGARSWTKDDAQDEGADAETDTQATEIDEDSVSFVSPYLDIHHNGQEETISTGFQFKF